MEEEKQDQFCKVSLNELLQAAYDVEVRVVGAIKQIFKHKVVFLPFQKFIVEVLIKDNVVVRCLKRYNQFQALNQVLRMNFKNIDLGLSEFPSKFQVVHREETRRKYFQDLLNRLIQTYLQKITNETNRRLFSTLYVFLTNGVKKEVAKTARKMSDSFEESFQEYESVIPNFKMAKSKGEGDMIDNKTLEGKLKSSSFGHTPSLMQGEDSKKKSFHELQFVGADARERAFNATEFLIQFEGDKQWKQRYLKLEESCLLIYKHKNDNHFKTKIEIFQANIEWLVRGKNFFDQFCQKMEIDNQPQFPEDKSVLMISHVYDYKKFLLKVKPNQKLNLNDTKQILQAASRVKQSTDIEGVFSPIGKIFVILHKIHFTTENVKTLPITFLRVKTSSGFSYETKRMTYTYENPISIKQGFMIPISNSFGNIFIEVIAIENEGILRHESQEKVVGLFTISFADFISYPSGQGLEKLKIKIEGPKASTTYQGAMEISVINYSHFSSIYADSYANENDGIMLSGLKSTSDTDELIITVDRVLRVIGNIALFITAFWRNVYLFKYPRMSYFFFIYLIILFNFGNSFLYIRLFACNFVIAMLYQLPKSRSLISNVLENYFFKFRHSSFINPLCLSSSQLKFRKWTVNLIYLKRDFKQSRNGKLTQKSEVKDRKFEEWTFQIHGKTFNVKQQCPSLIEKVFEVKKIVELVLRMISAAINTLEKVFNIICWADPKRSAIIFAMLLFVVTVAQPWIFQLIGTIFCIHRLVKGKNFYANKHYASNRKLAVYCLRYILNLHFPYLILGKQKKITTTCQKQIQMSLHDIYFPIRQDEKYKKFTSQIQHILGVYIDFEELQKNEKRSGVSLIHLVTIIQSCESRLKLEWISGKEGISDEFQELKKLTDQELVIDLWVESLIINFFLNTPSQLYTIFRPIRSDKALRNGKEDQIDFKQMNV